MRSIGLLSICILFAGLSQAAPETLSLQEKADSLQTQASTRVSSDACESHFQSLAQSLEGISAAQFNLREVDSQTPLLLSSLFSTRLEIRRRLKSYYLAGQFPANCVQAIRTSLRKIRELEDFIGATAQSRGHAPIWNVPQPPRGFSNSTLLNLEEGIDVSELRSGDLILSRGNYFSQAAIHRIADTNNTFDRISMVHIGPQKEISLIQTQMNSGATITPFSLDDQTRAVVYRYGNSEIAAKAAESLTTSIRSQKTPIPYDFKMTLTSSSDAYGGELIRKAFENASNGDLLFPLVLSSFNMGNTHFQEQLGITECQAFMPGDIESDPRFSMVLEYRNFSKIRHSWTEDAILSALYGWMDNQDYAFFPTKRQAHRGQRAFQKNHRAIPSNASSLTWTALLTLQETTGQIQDALENAEKSFTSEHGIAPAPYDLEKMLQELRETDSKKYRTWLQTKKNRDRPIFHITLH